MIDWKRLMKIKLEEFQLWPRLLCAWFLSSGFCQWDHKSKARQHLFAHSINMRLTQPTCDQTPPPSILSLQINSLITKRKRMNLMSANYIITIQTVWLVLRKHQLKSRNGLNWMNGWTHGWRNDWCYRTVIDTLSDRQWLAMSLAWKLRLLLHKQRGTLGNINVYNLYSWRHQTLCNADRWSTTNVRLRGRTEECRRSLINIKIAICPDAVRFAKRANKTTSRSCFECLDLKSELRCLHAVSWSVLGGFVI